MAMVLRGAMQRSYTSVGEACVQEILNHETVTLNMDEESFDIALAWILSQLIINLIIFAGYIPWWLNQNPMMPAIDVARDNLIFSLYAAKNLYTAAKMKGINSNIDKDLIWPRLDHVLRIGESVTTVEDPDKGMIVMDKPKMVTALNFAKHYV